MSTVYCTDILGGHSVREPDPAELRLVDGVLAADGVAEPVPVLGLAPGLLHRAALAQVHGHNRLPGRRIYQCRRN